MPIRHLEGVLYVDAMPVTDLVKRVGTPLYAYSWTDIEANYRRFSTGLRTLNHRIHYAVKANSNLAILNRLARLGASFDVVSAGELERVMRAGGHPEQVVFSGVGKSREEIAFAIKSQIGAVNVESVSELKRVIRVAQTLDQSVNVAFRVNPNVAVDTHPYIATALQTSKFGMTRSDVLRCAELAQKNKHINPVGIACHIGSQVFDVEPYAQALSQLLQLATELNAGGLELNVLNVGGGFGVPYEDDDSFPLDAFVTMILECIANTHWAIGIEPGRSIVADAGTLVTKVEYLKYGEGESPNFAVVDAAMNDLLRPALYDAWHAVEPVVARAGDERTWNVVGPICESGDFLAKDRILDLREGDLLAIRHAGAYGFALASNYNSRPRCPELLVDGKVAHVIRHRESLHDQIHLERIV